MDLSPEAALWFLPVVLPICLYVAWSDLSSMKIPNRAVYALALAYGILGPFLLPMEMYLWHWGHLLVILAIGIVMNAAGLVGAGDAKFAAAAAPFIARPDLSAVLFLLAGMIVAGYAGHRIARATPIRSLVPGWESWSSGKRFPMGLPLAGTLAAYLLLVAVGRL